MSTGKQQQDLIEMLKFVPRKFTIELSGYGGEIVMGEIDRKTFDYWISSGIDELSEFVCSSWSSEDPAVDIPKEFQFVDPGSWYECDSLAHSSGCELSRHCRLVVSDSIDQSVVFTCELDLSELEAHGITVSETINVDIDDIEREVTAFMGQSIEKGLFFSAEVELTQPFDPSLLRILYGTYHGWSLVENVEYGEDGSLSDNEGYSVTGKSIEFEVFANYDTDPDAWPATQQDIDESLMTSWLPADQYSPVYPGEYQVQMASFLQPLQMAVWCNDNWQYSNGQPVNCAVLAWRGVKYPTC